MKTYLRWSVLLILLAFITGIAVWPKWEYNLPAGQVLQNDSDSNGLEEKYVLKDQQLQVFEGSQLIWRTPPEWKIRQIKLADADNNQQTELLLVIWKKGSFGNSKPFWFKGADNQYTCHLFVYRLLAGRMKAVWCSSALEHPIIRLDVKDSDADGLNELNVTEGGYGFAYPLRQYLSQRETKWIWNEWGFERID